MHGHKILLVSNDPSLVEFLREGLFPMDSRQLQVVDSPDEAALIAGWGDPELIILHMHEWMLDSSIARFFWEVALCPRRIPIVAVGERYDSRRALAMFRLGVADYLSRPDHLGHLVPLIRALSEGMREETNSRVDVPARSLPRIGGRALSLN